MQKFIVGLFVAYAVLIAFSLQGCSSHFFKKSQSNTIIHNNFAFDRTKDSIALTGSGNIIWQFNYDKSLTKPHFHPLSLSDGTILTWVSPPDHPWHYGLWFSWKYINNVNYWEESRPTGRPDGITEWDNVQIKELSAGMTAISLDLSYHEPNKPALLTEKRDLTISSPAADGSYYIDWVSDFTAKDNVKLDRTPLPDQEGGKINGGYAGLSLRICKEAQDIDYAGTPGPITFEGRNFRTADKAIECSGTINGKQFGIAVLDHPDNINSPSMWFLINRDDMQFLNAAVICNQPHIMAKGQTLKLRYRIYVHPGCWDSKILKQKHESFLSL